MKNKIIYLVIGIVIGAVITAAGFLIFGKINQPKGIHNGERPDGIIKREDGENPPDWDDGEHRMRPDNQSDNQNTTDVSNNI